MRWSRLKPIYKILPRSARILDVGCAGFVTETFKANSGRADIDNFGVDYMATNMPAGFTFKQSDLDAAPIPYADDFFDLVIASHVIEHMKRPLELFSELVRVAKPGGTIYVEAPSERSLFMPGMPFGHKECMSLSFYDDPTHTTRPWTPQSFYRLSMCYGLSDIEAGYDTDAKARFLIAPVKIVLGLITRNPGWLQHGMWELIGWSSYVITRKPLSLNGAAKFSYAFPA